MKLSYDPEADAAYVQVAPHIEPGAVVRSEETSYLDCHIAVDYDSDDRVLGIEILSASTLFTPTALDVAGSE
ncbi:hypothetical protein BWO91_14585 [Plantibacter flavus]|uniref:DUF2283 domain-containing protein n=1 Tax=Plantibacter TaxID=190323 RepID=UPI00099D1918|nr:MULTISPECIES: DUF2283 domain-containing protein [Plantibacter]AQX81033.1 hypothetical protein BWO91_14585 [Plantibacter flavus]